jgi:hypothetical protein
MATTFKNAISTAVGTSSVIVYTAANNVKVTVLGISFTNLTTGFVTASVIISDPAPAGSFTANQSSVTTPTILTNVNTFNNISVGASVSGTGVPASTTISSFDAVAKTITLNNAITQTLTANVITFVGTVAATSYYVKDVVLPSNQSLRVINGGERLVLGASNTLSVVTNTASSCDVIVSLVEII